MSEVELYAGRVSPLGLGIVPHPDIQKYTGDARGKLLAFGTETCSIFPAANLAAR